MVRSVAEVARFMDEFFSGRSKVHRAMTRLAKALDEAGIPFAIAGAMAVNLHGHARTTADVDILLTREGLEKLASPEGSEPHRRARWRGRGWVEKFPGSKGLRDAVEDVKVDVLLTGEYPGDGKPKPVRFPDPSVAERTPDGLPVLPLDVLLELKIESGTTTTHRPRDLDDAIQLIRVNALPREHAERLDASVRAKFLELWDAAQIDEDF